MSSLRVHIERTLSATDEADTALESTAVEPAAL
jgi:hypothetical protein